MSDVSKWVSQVSTLLQQKKLLLVTAESCTGGGVAHALTEVAGASAWFERGFVTYSNRSKTELLGVSVAVLNESGAVSEVVAAAMAEGALANSAAHVAIAITGIAGPAGASPEKPVGTVCFAWSYQGKTLTEQCYFDGDRRTVREQSIAHALKGIVHFLCPSNVNI